MSIGRLTLAHAAAGQTDIGITASDPPANICLRVKTRRGRAGSARAGATLEPRRVAERTLVERQVGRHDRAAIVVAMEPDRFSGTS